MTMKLVVLSLLSTTLGVDAATENLSPITRVVELLQGLATKIEQDGKAEEDLFDKYVCWATTVIESKKGTNAAAKDRIDALEAYIADIEAGKIEFTSERTDLEKLIDKLNKDIEASEAKREKEKKDFEAAEDEMKKGISALEEAIAVLDEATKEHKGSLLSVKREVQTFKQGEHSTASMEKVIELGEKLLSKGDANFLKKLLTGAAPKGDFDKLNKKATFKMKYKARSGKIQKILADMLQTFEFDLKLATNKEKEAEETFTKLNDSKKDELKSAEDALAEGGKESTAKGMAKEEAQQEVDDLKDQISKDEGFIKDTEAALKDMKEKWSERSKLRVLEIKSINEAIAVLNSDDAKDTFEKSFKSQGYLLVQKSATSVIQRQARRASELLREAGRVSKDMRLTQLAVNIMMHKKGHFDKVIQAIDDMVKTLKEEEGEDLGNKEDCESEREETTADARMSSLKVDDATEEIARQEAIIKETVEQIKLKEEEIKKLEEEIKEATRQREDEKMEFEASQAEDKAAVELIEKAMDVLKSFREENNLDLVQRGAQEPPKVEAGKAPPPPPPTGFDEPYGGAKGESAGIQSILGMIKEDIEKDITKAEEAEEEAIKAFEKMKEDAEAAIESAKKAIADYEEKKAKAETAISEEETKKQDAKKALDSTMESIKEAEPGCNFITVNFESRIKNRQLEIDGLLKAKSILQGAAYSANK